MGELIASYDIGINKLEQVLEFLITHTIVAFKGDKSAILATADVVLIMRDAIKLYHIEPNEKSSRLKVLTNEISDTAKYASIAYKSGAKTVYQRYQSLNLKEIPVEVRGIMCEVFYDNEKYILK